MKVAYNMLTTIFEGKMRKVEFSIGVVYFKYYSMTYNMVPRAGLEPAHPKARDFKSLVSTDFTIWADGFFTANSY